jgi:hypothetical protein
LSRRAREEGDLDRRFEGRARLEKLLSDAGCVADAQDVAAAFQDAQKNGVPASVVIDALFDDEPKFTDPADARALFGNLFGLWDLLAAGEKVDLEKPPARERTPKPPPPEPPEPFGDAPDDAWVERGWKLLDQSKKDRQRLSDAFENRQDALLSWLDQSGLDDHAFSVAREALFEAFALLQLGGLNVAAARPGREPVEVPAALTSRAEEHLFEAEHDEAHPLSEAALEAARQSVQAGLSALWAATRKN